MLYKCDVFSEKMQKNDTWKEKNDERKEKVKRKKKKIQSKECAWCEKNRSIGENEGKLGQKDEICPYFWIMLY